MQDQLGFCQDSQLPFLRVKSLGSILAPWALLSSWLGPQSPHIPTVSWDRPKHSRNSPPTFAWLRTSFDVMRLWGVSIPASNGTLSQLVANPHVERGPEGLPWFWGPVRPNSQGDPDLESDPCRPTPSDCGFAPHFGCSNGCSTLLARSAGLHKRAFPEAIAFCPTSLSTRVSLEHGKGVFCLHCTFLFIFSHCLILLLPLPVPPVLL